METTMRLDRMLSTLNSTDIGTLESIQAKLQQIQVELETLKQPVLASRIAEMIEALSRGDVATFKRGRAFLQSKIGHLRGLRHVDC